MTAPRTIPDLFLRAVERHDLRAFMLYKAGGAYVPISAREFREDVELAAHALIDLGIAPGDRIALLSENRPGWAYADLATLFTGAWSVPIYTSLPADEVQYILEDSGAVACFVSNETQLAKVEEARARCPALRHVIALDRIERQDGSLLTAHALCERGLGARAARPDAVRERLQAIDPEDTASILYTSGTTGRPKGVMLSHGNFTTNVVDSLACLPIESDDTYLSFLPLSHSFERLAGYYIMIHAGVTIAYAESLDTVPQNMLEVRPTVIASAPRLYEKMYARILHGASEAGGVKKRLVFWARRVAIAWADADTGGRRPGRALRIKHALADWLVYKKIRERTGGRLRICVSGSAPLAPVIARFFYGIGMPVLEGYGLTETSPVVSVNRRDAIRFGTVGQPIPHVEVRIEPDAERGDSDRRGGEGEILVRGPNVMQGYYKMPDKTREVLTPDGWFHTGDIGFIDGDGFITITDRKKDLLKTSGGKYIAPQPLENELKTSRYVSQAVVVGNRRKYASVLLVPNFDTLDDWAREHGLPTDDHEKLIEQEAVQALYEAVLEGVNRGKASFETLKRFRLLPADFTIEAGELTPTLKVKRRVVEEKHADLIGTMYEEELPVP